MNSLSKLIIVGLLSLFYACLTCACGQTGPLYLPDDETQEQYSS